MQGADNKQRFVKLNLLQLYGNFSEFCAHEFSLLMGYKKTKWNMYEKRSHERHL